MNQYGQAEKSSHNMENDLHDINISQHENFSVHASRLSKTTLHDSIRIKLLESQKKCLIFISLILLVVIVLLGILVLNADKAHSQTKIQARTETNGEDVPKRVGQERKAQVPKQNDRKQNIKPIDLNTKKPSLQKVVQNIDAPLVSEGGHIPSYSHQHNEVVFDYPTVGIPVPGKRYNSTKVKPEDMHIFDQAFLDLFKPYNDTDCNYVHYGRQNDGGYVLCDNFFGTSNAFVNIGINGQDGLGCDITANHPMPNYQYDCTNRIAPVCSKNNNMDAFFGICIGSKSQNTNSHIFYTYEDILRRHNLTDKRITFKIDCEGCEYSALKAMPLKYLELIDNFIFEVHLGDIHNEEWGMLDIFKSLAEHFVNVNYHYTNYGCWAGRTLKSKAVELSLVNKKLIKLKSNSRSFTLHPLNQKGNKYAVDCQQSD